MTLVERVKQFVRSDRRRTYTAALATGYLYTAVSVLLNIALVPVFIDGLGKTKFGVWLTLYALGQWVGYAVNWLSPGVVNRIGEHRARGDAVGAATIAATTSSGYAVVGTSVMLLGLAVLPVSSVGFLGGALSTDTKVAVVLAAVWMGVQVQSQVRINILHAGQRMYMVHAIQIGVLTLGAGSAVVLVLAGGDLAAVSASYAVAALLGLIAFRIAAARVINAKPARSFDRGILRDLARISTPYAISGAGGALLWSDLLLLAFLTSPEQVAEYGVAYKVLEAALQLVWRVSDSTQPYVVEFNAQGDTHALRMLHERMVKLSVVLGGSIAGALLFLWEPLLRVWVGPDRFVGRPILWLMAAYLVLQSFMHASLVFPWSAATMKRIGWVQLAEGAAKVLVAAVLVVTVGPIGVPIGSIAALTVFTVWYVPRFTLRWLDVAPSGFATRVLIRTVPVIAATAVAAWLASEMLTVDSIVPLGIAAAIAGLGFLAGVFIVGRGAFVLSSVKGSPG